MSSLRPGAAAKGDEGVKDKPPVLDGEAARPRAPMGLTARAMGAPSMAGANSDSSNFTRCQEKES